MQTKVFFLKQIYVSSFNDCIKLFYDRYNCQTFENLKKHMYTTVPMTVLRGKCNKVLTDFLFNSP